MKREYFFAGISIICWGSFATVGKLLLQSLDTMSILFYSALVAAVFLFTLNLFTGRLSLLHTLRIKEVIFMIVLSLIGMVFHNALCYYGLTMIKAQQSFIINYLWPILIVLFSCIFFKEKMTIPKGIAMLLSFLGVAIVATEGNFSELGQVNFQGVVACVIAAICYALFSVLNMKVTCDKFVAMMIYYIIMTILLLGGLYFSKGEIPSLSLYQWGGMLWNGIFVYGLPYTTWALALDIGDTAKLSNLAYLTPFVSLIYIYVFLHEPISISSFVGLAFILSGVVIQMQSAKVEKLFLLFR